jgi:CheY-like chemotaxis protein
MATIFYTDDDQEDTFIFAQAIKEINTNYNKNYDLATIEDGDELLNHLYNPPPAPRLIFLDLNMPGKGGRETLKEIKENDSLKKFPVVIFSTSSNPDDIDFTYQHGASLYIHKPTRYVGLKKLLEQCLSIDWQNYKRPIKEEFYLSAS